MPFGDAKYFYAEGFGREVCNRLQDETDRDDGHAMPPPLYPQRIAQAGL